MTKILVLYYSGSGNTEKLAKAVAKGACGVRGVQVTVKRFSSATSSDLASYDAIAFGSPNYFSYMSGPAKEFFDAAWIDTREKAGGKPKLEISRSMRAKLKGKPAAAFTSGGSDSASALRSMECIFPAFEFRRVKGVVSQESARAEGIRACTRLGEMLATAATRKSR